MSNGNTEPSNPNDWLENWLETEDPENQGAFLEDALTEADAEQSNAIPAEHLPADFEEGD